MSAAIVVNDTVRVPASAIVLRAVRASGPGGQNVNKVATKVELHVDADAIEGLPSDARARLDALTQNRRDAAGWLLVTSQVTRNQTKNVDDAREKVRALILASLRRPRTRRATRPTGAAKEQRLMEKKRRAQVKRWRSTRDD